MPNIGQVLKDEICRLARKETKTALTGLVRDKIRLKKSVADLKRRIGQLERDHRFLVTAESRRQKTQAAAPPEAAQKIRITSRGIRNLRSKLGLSQAGLGKLLGVSDQSVYMWERKEGRLLLREATKQALLGVRDIGAREAKKRLAAKMEAEQPASKKRRGRRKKRKKTARKKR